LWARLGGWHLWGEEMRRAEYENYWLEEPLSAFDKSAHAALARRLDLSVTVRETICMRCDFRDYIQLGAVDSMQADATKLSGIGG
jgi:L-alanine-DL-glutamate epimerase-like enolase superfamily enzyme